MFIFFVVCNSSVVFTRLFLNALGDGGGGDSGVGSAAHQVGRVEEMSEEKEVGGVHQSAVLKVVPGLSAEITASFHLSDERKLCRV